MLSFFMIHDICRILFRFISRLYKKILHREKTCLAEVPEEVHEKVGVRVVSWNEWREQVIRREVSRDDYDPEADDLEKVRRQEELGPRWSPSFWYRKKTTWKK